MYTEDEVYSYPNRFGLIRVDELNIAPSWEFNIFAVFYSPDKGRYYWATDSGCSCPIPFEYTRFSDLHDGTFGDMMNAIDRWALNGWGPDGTNPNDVIRFKDRLRNFNKTKKA